MIDITLAELKVRQLTVEELQDVIIKLINLHNSLDKKIFNLTLSGRIKSRKQAIADSSYGL